MKKQLKRQVLTALTATALLGGAGGSVYAMDTDHVLVTGDYVSEEDNVINSNGGWFYGVVGGNAYADNVDEEGNRAGITGTFGRIDSNLTTIVDLVNEANTSLPSGVNTVVDLIGDVNTVLSNQTQGATSDTELTGDAGLTLQNYGKNWVRYYGAIGGDFSVNTGLAGTIDYSFSYSILGQSSTSSMNLLEEAVATNIIRTGNVSNALESGIIIGGAGASAAAAIGNLGVTMDYTYSDTLYGIFDVSAGIDADMTMDGKTHVTVDGDVTTDVGAEANVIGWTNGGLALSLGGTTSSTVTGDSVLTIDGTDRADYTGSYGTPDDDLIGPLMTTINVMYGSKVSAIGVAGGGTAISTMGGTAETTVKGSTTVSVNNATVIGVAGGGVAGSVDLTTLGNLVYSAMGKDTVVGDNDGSLTLTADQVASLAGISLPDGLSIELKTDQAIYGGTATSTTGDTNVALTGSTTAVGVMGGGLAAAVQTYAVRDTNENGGHATTEAPADYDVGNVYGTSTATAITGRSTITVDLDGTGDISAVSEAIQNLYTGLTNNSTQADVLADLKGQGMVLGLFGGGTAVAYGNADAILANTTDGAIATATTAGSDIYLNSGYAAGVFGGGAAIGINTAQAKSVMTDDVNIYTASGMETVGLFGGGLAWSAEQSQNTGTDFMDTPSATSTVQTVNITNEGDTDGIFGGGVAIGVSNRTGAQDAVATVGTSNITVNDGTVSTVNMSVLMSALKNSNDNGYPWWSFMGYNLSSYMVDIQGILDETAIVGGGLGLGLTGYTEVATSNITINGGTVEGNILGGGIAIDNMTEAAGAHVGESTITLNGGTVEGSVYAGGAINKTTSQEIKGTASADYGSLGYETKNTSSTVDTATVILNGATVEGEISGQGFEVTTVYSEENYNPFYNGNEITYEKTGYDSVGESTLVITGTNTLTPLDTSSGTYTGSYKIHDFDYINVAAGSTTRLEGLTAGDASTAIIYGGLVTVSDSAYLDVTGLDQSDTAYHVAIDTEEGSTFWTNANLVYDRTEGYATGDAGDDGTYYDLTWSALSESNAAAAASDMVDAIDAGPLQDLIEDAMAKSWSEDQGIRAGGKSYFSDWSSNAPTANSVYGRGVLLGEDAAVTGNTLAIARVMADTVMERLSFTEDYIQGSGWVNNDGGVWARYIHRRYETDGMGSSFGHINSHTDYDGAIVGVDFKKVGKFQSGVAIHYGSGDGYGRISHNDYDAWGFSLYGSIKDEESHTNLMADIGYMTSDNDIRGSVAGHEMTSDRDVDAWTIGVRGEKEYIYGQNQIVPYVGLRYMSLNPAKYSIYYDGQKAFEADADNQNLWMIPIGVVWRNETVTANGWRVTPKVNLSYIWAFGDTDTDVTVDIGGVGSSLYYDVMDENSWLAALGVEATKEAWSFGVSYGYQKGDNTENRGWLVNLSYAF